MLGHDTHGHAEAEHDGLHRLPADRRRATSRTAATSSASSARPTPTRAAGRDSAPPLTHDRPGADPPEAPGGRVRRQPVGHDDGDQHRRRPASGGRRAPRQPRRRRLAPAQRSVQPVPHRLDRLSASPTPPPAAPRARRWRRSRSARTRSPVRSCRRRNLISTGGPTSGRARRSRSRSAGTHELFLVFRTVTGGATGGNLFNLNWVEFQGAGVGTGQSARWSSLTGSRATGGPGSRTTPTCS